MNLSSYNDYSLPSDLDFFKWDSPGIVCMECVKSKKSLLFSSSNALTRILKLAKGLSTFSIKNKQVLKYFEKYGPESFRFILLEYGEEFADPHFRKKKLRELKRTWEGSLY